MPFTAKSENLFLIIQNLQFLEINILAKTYIVILSNIPQLCQVRQRGVGEGGYSPPATVVHKRPPSYHEALTQCCFKVVPTLKMAGQH